MRLYQASPSHAHTLESDPLRAIYAARHGIWLRLCFGSPPGERAKTGRSVRCCDLSPHSRDSGEGQQSRVRAGRAIAHEIGSVRSLPVSSLRVQSLLVRSPKVEESYADDDCPTRPRVFRNCKAALRSEE